MAIVTGIFGSISGRVGNIVYRNRNGKIIAATLPAERSTKKNEREIENEKMFGLTGIIAKTINSLDLLKYFWHPVRAKNQSTYNVIFKKNYGMLDIENLSGTVLLTSGEGFGLINPSLYPGESNIVIECKALGDRSAFDTNAEKYVAAAGIIVFKKPIIKNIPMFYAVPFKSKKYLFYPNDYISINLEFAGSELMIFESYSIKKVFAVFVTLDEDERPVQHSMTFTSKD
jgi:hypothetical protein